MAESTYESRICSIPSDARSVYSVLSRMDNLNRVKDLLPKDKIQEMEIDEDSIRMKVDGLSQKITVRIVERKDNDTIKMASENSPIPLTFWIQLKQVSELDTRVRLTLRTELPFMLRMMLDKKMQQGIDQAAEMLTRFPYQQWAAES